MTASTTMRDDASGLPDHGRFTDPLEDLAPVVRVVLASLSLGAGVVHLVMVPSHMQASNLDGWSFAIVGWLQVLAAIALVVRPGRLLMLATVGLNAAVIGGWIWSRTVGLPVGGHAGVAEAVGGVDLLTVGFEAALVLGALLVIWRPALGQDLPQASMVVASAVPILVLVATSVAVSDPSVVQHGHTETVAAAATLASTGPTRCDLGFNPAAYWTEGAITGVASAATPAATSAAPTLSADGHAHGATAPAPAAAGTPTTTAPPIVGSPELDELIRSTTATGDEGKDAAVIIELGNASDEAYDNWLRWLPQLGSRCRCLASRRPRSGAAASTCPDRCGRPGRCARRR